MDYSFLELSMFLQDCLASNHICFHQFKALKWEKID